MLRRSIEFAQPYRRTIWAALGFITAVTLCTVAGPLLVRIATDHGLGDGNGTALNIVIAVYVAVVDRQLRPQSPAVPGGQHRRRGLPARAARSRVFERLQAQSMAYYDRNKAGRARVADDRRHREHGRADPVGPAAVRQRRPARRDHDPGDAGDQLAADAGRARRRADPRRRLRALPAQEQRRLPRRAREGRPEPRHAAGGHRRRARHPGVPPPAGADPAVPREQPGAVPQQPAHGEDQHLLLRAGRGHRGVRRGHRRRRRRVDGAPRTRSPSARSPRSCCGWPTCSTRCSSSASCTTRCRARPPRCTSCTSWSTPCPTSPSTPTRSTCRPPARSSPTT